MKAPNLFSFWFPSFGLVGLGFLLAVESAVFFLF
jgi:hypothetical protein